jgi:hypothetical protein
MYDEMRFLFSVDPNVKNTNNDSENNKVVDTNNPAQAINYKKELNQNDKNFYINKYVINKGDVKNYIKSDVNKSYQANNKNPYLDLLEFTNSPDTSKGLKIKSSDLAYLRDIGVFPINRLMILRRYPEGVVIPVDLNDLDVEPVSTVIGWVKRDSSMLEYTFNEKWQKMDSGGMLHKLLRQIINDEFGIDIGSIIPVPGWGLGFLFGILNKMGLTDYDRTNLPIGDPNVLMEAITRPHEQFGLESSFNFELETSYEQKYIAGIDPTVSSMEMLNNLLVMGTSDTKIIGKKGSQFEKDLRAANENPTNGAGWTKLTGDVVTAFVSALSSTIKKDIGDISEFLTTNKIKVEGSEDDSISGDNQKDSQGKSNQTKEKDSVTTQAVSLIENKFTQLLQSDLVSTILASTLARYRWPLRGSISMFTGDANTPWHLTIGNPYAPLLSMNNIYVKNVQVSESSEMSYNDIPKYRDVKISMEQGRNLGKNEIYDLFGVRYKRHYNKTDSYKSN